MEFLDSLTNYTFLSKTLHVEFGCTTEDFEDNTDVKRIRW